jgi:hypothetical protein
MQKGACVVEKSFGDAIPGGTHPWDGKTPVKAAING